MKILFITGLYPKDKEEELKIYSGGLLHNAPNVYQWAVIDGLVRNKADFTVVSCPFLPAFPIRYKKLYTPCSPIFYNGKKIGDMIPYNDLLVYKTISIENALRNYVRQWIYNNKQSDDKLMVLTYQPYHPFIAALKQFQRNHEISVASIVTDLVDDMLNFKDNQGPLKRIQCFYEKMKTKYQYKFIDKFVLLTKAMEDFIPQAVGRSIVVEGMSNTQMQLEHKHNTKNKTILYTGLLESYTCVDDLVSAFMKISNRNIRLVICGAGPLKSKIEEAALLDKRIDFKGLVSREQALLLQRESTILINPRKPNGGLTKYSFPSKTMEYLSSGTPMIGYKLEGIPEEYFDYFFTIDSLDEPSLIAKIVEVISLSDEELFAKAKSAYNFIVEKKTSYSQVKRIVNFLEE